MVEMTRIELVSNNNLIQKISFCLTSFNTPSPKRLVSIRLSWLDIASVNGSVHISNASYFPRPETVSKKAIFDVNTIYTFSDGT